MGTCECHIKDAYRRRIVETLKEPLNQTNKAMHYSSDLMSGNFATFFFFLCSELMRLNLSSEWCHLRDTHNRCRARGSTLPELFHFTPRSSSLCMTSSLTLIQQDFPCLWRQETRAGPLEDDDVGALVGSGSSPFCQLKSSIQCQIVVISLFYLFN